MRFRMQWVEKAGRGGRNTTGNGLDVVTYHTLSDYENEISPVVHFMLDRLQIGLHFWNGALGFYRSSGLLTPAFIIWFDMSQEKHSTPQCHTYFQTMKWVKSQTP